MTATMTDLHAYAGTKAKGPATRKPTRRENCRRAQPAWIRNRTLAYFETLPRRIAAAVAVPICPDRYQRLQRMRKHNTATTRSAGP
jgi:hypothetical protein